MSLTQKNALERLADAFGTNLEEMIADARPEGYGDGKNFFDLGVAAALREQFHEAFLLYTKSIEMCPKPAPYLNRAQILIKKIRYKEAHDDLIEAQKIDQLEGNEFLSEIQGEIDAVLPFVANYHNGVREKLISDIHVHNDSFSDLRNIAKRIFGVSFGSSPSAAYPFNAPLSEYHFFNELDNIVRFEDVDIYPEAKDFLEFYTSDFIVKKVNEDVDIAAYSRSESLLNEFLCSYDEPDMRMLRRLMLHDIHKDLIIRDYGDQMFGTFDNPEPEVIREAAYLISPVPQ